MTTESNNPIEIIEHAQLEIAQKKLLPKADEPRGTDNQRNFIRMAAENSAGFCEEILRWGTSNGKSSPPVFSRKLTEKEFLDVPWNTEEMVFNTWQGLPPNLAARSGTWTRIHVELIQNGLIESSFLAFDVNRSDQSGKARIHSALNGSDNDIDKCVRTILRRLGGVVERSARTTFVDCPLAKAWWRHYYAIEALSEIQRHIDHVSTKKLSDVIRASNWPVLIEAMVSRLTVIGTREIRIAIIRSMLDSSEQNQKQFKQFLDRIGRRSTTQMLALFEHETIVNIIDTLKQSDAMLGEHQGVESQ